MKIKQEKITRAYITLANMGARVLPANAALRLFKLKKVLAESFEFVTEEERKYVDELGGEVKENGDILFSEPEKTLEFQKKRKELSEMEVDLDFVKPVISMSEMKETSMIELEALDDFVDFK